MVGSDPALLERLIARSGLKLWEMDSPADEYSSFDALFRAICSQALASPLDITDVATKVKAHCSSFEIVRLIQSGSRSHTLYLAGVLKDSGDNVSMWD